MEFPEAFIRLAQIETNERITITSNKMNCSVSKLLTGAISPIFFQAIKNNPTLKEIHLPINENIKEFFEGKSIDPELFLKMSIILDNQDFIKMWKITNEFNIDNVLKLLMAFIKNNGKIENLKDEIEYIGEHFEEIANKLEFETIPSEFLSEIFKKTKGIESEKQIYKYIIERLKEEKEEESRKKLMESIDMRGLNNQEIQELIETLKYEDLSEQFFSVFKCIILERWNYFEENENKDKNEENEDENEKEFLNGDDSEKGKEKCHVIQYEEGQYFKGIIKYLQDKYGKNIHHQGIISISASYTPDSYFIGQPYQVIDYEWDGKWHSESDYDDRGEWWQIDFKKMKVKISGYSIKQKYSQKKKWIIEGKNEGEEWKQIDILKDKSYNPPKISYHPIDHNTQSYQYIRLRPKKKNGSCHFEITNFEIFGEIQEE